MLSRQRTRNRLLEVTPGTPDDDAVSLADVKDYLNVTTTTDDDLITAMLAAATRAAEESTRRAFITQQVTTQWLGFDLPVRVFRPPIQAIFSVHSIYEGTATDEGTADFYLIGENGMRPRLYAKSVHEWEADDIQILSIVTTNGYGDTSADVPDPIKDAIKLIVSNLYDNPDDFVKQGVGPIPAEAAGLLAPFECPTR